MDGHAGITCRSYGALSSLVRESLISQQGLFLNPMTLEPTTDFRMLSPSPRGRGIKGEGQTSRTSRSFECLGTWCFFGAWGLEFGVCSRFLVLGVSSTAIRH